MVVGGAVEALLLSLDPRQNGTRISMSCQSMHEAVLAYSYSNVKEISGPTAQSMVTSSKALEKLFLSLDTCKSTEKWYRVERERVTRIQSWCLECAHR